MTGAEVAGRARQVADRIAQLPDLARSTFAPANDAELKKAIERLKDVNLKIAEGVSPVIQWIERNRHPATAERLGEWICRVYNEAHDWALAGKPKGGAESFPEYPMNLPQEADRLATSLRQWADEIEAGQAPPGKGGKGAGQRHGEPDVEAWLSAPELAKRYSRNVNALSKKLARWRPGHAGDYRETEFNKPREPRFLYRVSAVLPIVQASPTAPVASVETAAERQSK